MSREVTSISGRRAFGSIIIVALLLLTPSNFLQSLQAQTLGFSGAIAYQDVLKQMSYGARVPGSPALLETAEYIRNNLSSIGWSVVIQNFTYENALLNRSIQAHNLIATIGKPLPATYGNPTPNILVGAHYDSRPVADQPQCNRTSLPVPGADDGASGVAVLLELGRVFAENRPLIGLTLVFFDAEDSGLCSSEMGWIEGSTYYVNSLNSTQRSQIQAAIILDMVGYSQLVLQREPFSDYAINNAIWSEGQKLGYPQFASGEQAPLLDDHRPFLDAGIRAVDIIDFDYPYWHTLHDTADKVSPASLEAVGRTMEAFILSGTIPAAALPPSFYLILTGLILAVGATMAVFIRTRGTNRRLSASGPLPKNL